MDDDISILSDFEEDSSPTRTTGPSATFSLGSSNVPASTHALKTAYQDLRNRYNESQQQIKALRRKNRGGSEQKMASENGFFSGSNGTPVDIREQGAAAMPDSILDDQVKQGHINHLQLEIKQTQTRYNIILTELNRTQQQFEDFRSKHARCFQEKDDLYTQIRNTEMEKRKLIETVEKLKAKIENQMSCKNCNQSFKKNVGKPVEDVYPSSFPSSQKGVCVVSVDEFEKLEEQMQLSQKQISTLTSLLEQQKRTIQALFGGQTLSDNDRRDLAAGLSHVTDLRLSLQDHGDTGPVEVELQGRQLRRESNTDLRIRLERQDPVSDETENIYYATHSVAEHHIDNTKQAYRWTPSDSRQEHKENSTRVLTTSGSLLKENFSGNDKFGDDLSLEIGFKDAQSMRLPPPGTSMTSNIKRQEAMSAVDRVVRLSAKNRASSTPQPNSHLLRVSKEPLVRTSSSPVHISSSIPGAANNQQTSLSGTKSPTLLDPVRIPSSNLLQTTLQPDSATKVPSVKPGQSFLIMEPKELTPGSQNISVGVTRANPPGALMPSAVRESLPHRRPSENSTQETGPQPLNPQRACPICGGAFPRMSISEFQNHVFDCYDNTADSGEIERPEVATPSGDNPEVNQSGQTDRKCPVCDTPFNNDFPHSVFERHVQEHFDEAPLHVDDFAILNP